MTVLMPQLALVETKRIYSVSSTYDIYTYSVDVSGVELGGLFEEEQAGMGVHHILYEGHHVLRDEMGAVPTCDQRHKLRSLVVTAGCQPAIRAQSIHSQKSSLLQRSSLFYIRITSLFNSSTLLHYILCNLFAQTCGSVQIPSAL
jgi:hypothetical protein